MEAGVAPPGADPAIAELPWPARLGAALLRRRAAATGGEAAWFDLLPDEVMLPTTVFTGDELEAARLAPGGTEWCRTFSRVLRAAAEGPLAPSLAAAGVRTSDLAGPLVAAASLAQSRSFVVDNNGTRVVAPGIDLSNHAPRPTAAVRITHAPNASQGAVAAAEVAPPAPVGESVMVLVAGENGVKAGQPVTISYGPHSLDVLFSVYGFLPPVDPATDATVLFDTLTDVANAAVAVAADSNISADAASLLPTITAALAADHPRTDWTGMVVTAGGCEPRAVRAARAAAAALAPAFAAKGARPPNAGDVMAAGVASLLTALASEGPEPPATPAGRLAGQLVARRVDVLLAAADAIDAQ